MKHILWLPYSKPPLSMNQRLHWAKRNQLTQDIRQAAKLLARLARLPKGLEHVDVGLHYAPGDNRRRDSDNLTPILKAACDGLVDYGLTEDDTHQQMTKHMAVIHPAMKTPPGPNGSRIWLTIETK